MVYRLRCTNKYQNYFFYPLIFIVVFSLTISCNRLTNWICGDLGKYEKEAIIKVQNSFGKIVSIEPIPCELIYVNMVLKSSSIDSTSVSLIHKIIYDIENKKGWQTINVYDRNRKYMYSHHYSGEINVHRDE
jgi:hypothetical protein